MQIHAFIHKKYAQERTTASSVQQKKVPVMLFVVVVGYPGFSETRKTILYPIILPPLLAQIPLKYEPT